MIFSILADFIFSSQTAGLLLIWTRTRPSRWAFIRYTVVSGYKRPLHKRSRIMMYCFTASLFLEYTFPFCHCKDLSSYSYLWIMLIVLHDISCWMAMISVKSQPICCASHKETPRPLIAADILISRKLEACACAVGSKIRPSLLQVITFHKNFICNWMQKSRPALFIWSMVYCGHYSHLFWYDDRTNGRHLLWDLRSFCFASCTVVLAVLQQ